MVEQTLGFGRGDLFRSNELVPQHERIMSTVSARMIIWFLALGHVPASKALHVLIQLVDGNIVPYLRPLHTTSAAEISE